MGRVVTLNANGWFGLGADAGILPAGNDWDSAVRTGFYRDTGSQVNGPTSDVGATVFAIGYNGANTTQLYFAQDTRSIYFRSQVSGVWTDWGSLYTTENRNHLVNRTNSTSFTINANAPIVETELRSSSNITITLDTEFTNNDLVIINKALASGETTINTGDGNFFYPNGISDTSVTIPDGTFCTLRIFRTDSNTWTIGSISGGNA